MKNKSLPTDLLLENYFIDFRSGCLTACNAPQNKSCTYGVSYLDDKLGGILRDDIVLIGAPTGKGKTTLSENIVIENANQGKKIVFFRLEGKKTEFHQKYYYKILADMYYADKNRYSQDVSYKNWLLSKCNLDKYAIDAQTLIGQIGLNIKTYDFTHGTQSVDIVGVMNHLNSLNCDLIVLDHINYLDFYDMECVEETKIMKFLRQFVEQQEIPVIVITHLQKNLQNLVPSLSDIYGSSNKSKISSVTILISPHTENYNHQEKIYPTIFRIAKDRCGNPDSLVGVQDFEAKKGKYSNDYEEYTLKGCNALSDSPIYHSKFNNQPPLDYKKKVGGDH